ncbi:hypothetical protein [Arabidopsis thaliana]|uniref:Uncharacterized protein AT4g17070 n=1 Tax=Arabidopsis thaliana TaxID=3702 RepID=O23551_ARATH|nr:hypothetical protein [Arabidopsis thaliana]CAB80978.1 hypothetical protein [Arabidopsis thaliana]
MTYYFSLPFAFASSSSSTNPRTLRRCPSIKRREPGRFTATVLLLIGLISCVIVYAVFSSVLRPSQDPTLVDSAVRFKEEPRDHDATEDGEGGCCRGIDNLELWGPAVKWGTDFKFNSSDGCCKACKVMCSGNDGPCLCDSWVFCGNKEDCGSKFGECWLKKQKDVLVPDRQGGGEKVMWTSGLIFGQGQAPFGPPYAMIQGILQAEGNIFTPIPTEHCPTISRGSVAWVGSGPEFFISLANHHEWKQSYTVFGLVLPEDMDVVETIAGLPTRADVWNSVNVSVLEKPVSLTVRRMKTGQEQEETGS